MSKEYIVNQLYDIGAVRFGSFTLKSGILSPIYLDLRLIISYPNLLKQISDQMWIAIKDLPKDCICGVPYTALPIATALSITYQIPMIMRRKERKDYGTKKLIEGSFNPGSQCVIIEDLITSGSSILETITPLEEEGLKISDAVVLIDRQQGGREILKEKGYHLHSVFNLSELLHILENNQKITSCMQAQVSEFLGITCP